MDANAHPDGRKTNMYDADFDVTEGEISVFDPYSSNDKDLFSIPAREGAYYLHQGEEGSETAVLIHHEDRTPDNLRIGSFERVGTIVSDSSIVAISQQGRKAVFDDLTELYEGKTDSERVDLDAQALYNLDSGVAIHLLKDCPVAVFQSGSALILSTSDLAFKDAAHLVGVGLKKRSPRRG